MNLTARLAALLAGFALTRAAFLASPVLGWAVVGVLLLLTAIVSAADDQQPPRRTSHRRPSTSPTMTGNPYVPRQDGPA